MSVGRGGERVRSFGLRRADRCRPDQDRGPHTGAVVVAAGAAAFRVVEATRFASRSRSEEVGACGPRSGPRYDGRPPYRASLAVGAGALAGRGVVRVGFHATSPEPPPSPESALVAGSASAG